MNQLTEQEVRNIIREELRNFTLRDRMTITNLLQIMDGRNIQVGKTTGTMIGTEGGATGQKLGFFAATPVTQRTGVAVTAAGIHAALVSLGLITA